MRTYKLDPSSPSSATSSDGPSHAGAGASVSAPPSRDPGCEPPVGALITPIAGEPPPVQRQAADTVADPFRVHLDGGAGGEPLAHGDRAQLESSFGVGLAGVRVHDDRGAHQRAAELGARAFSDGADVYFGAGPREAGGVELLAHEVAHTVAAGGGRSGEARQDVTAEASADAAAQAAARGARADIAPTAPALRMAPMPSALGQQVARVQIHRATAEAVESALVAESELVPSGQAPGGFPGYATRGEAELRARAAVDDGAGRPEIHVTVILRDPGDEATARYHVYDTGRRPLRTDGDDPTIIRLLSAVEQSGLVSRYSKHDGQGRERRVLTAAFVGHRNH